MDVKAAVAFEATKPLQIETVQLDGPKVGEVMVEIHATGICHTHEFTLSGATACTHSRHSASMDLPYANA